MTFATSLALLKGRSHRWLVTGAAGFIGSNLVEALLGAGQEVVGLDNFSTGYRDNLHDVRQRLPESYDCHFRFVEGDIRDRDACRQAATGADFVLHQAALGSVPRSIEDPLTAHDVNVTGFLHMLDAAKLAGVKRFIYAASSSTYGDEPTLPKQEHLIGNPLSPYAVTKLANEIYAAVYARCYGFKATGLRYFNIFGPRQDPEGAYAAVIPKWTAAMVGNEPVTINGDGQTSRDFCFVANAVEANVRAALAPDQVQGEVFNVAFGRKTTLNELFALIREGLSRHQIHYGREPAMDEFRAGDIHHSVADISKAAKMIGYSPSYDVSSGLQEALPWYIRQCAPSGKLAL